MPKPSKSAIAAAVALGVQYGPAVLEAAKKAGLTPETVLKKQVQKTDARKNAMEHADHLIDGSVLTVFEGDRRLFVVFTGDRPVASHPQTKTPLDRLVDGYDLTKRVRPKDVAPGSAWIPRPSRGQKGSAASPGDPQGPQA